MAQFQHGNNYWQFRNKHGRGYKYEPEALWNEFVEYAKWVDETPLFEEKQFAFQGVVTTHDAPKMRAMTIRAFSLFADISRNTFNDYKNNPDFSDIITRIEDAIYQQKLEGAAADLLNPNIIARELGLKDQQEITGKDGAPIASTLTPDQIDKLIDKL